MTFRTAFRQRVSVADFGVISSRGINIIGAFTSVRAPRISGAERPLC